MMLNLVVEGQLKILLKKYTIKILVLTHSEIINIQNNSILRDKSQAKKEFLNSIKVFRVKISIIRL